MRSTAVLVRTALLTMLLASIMPTWDFLATGLTEHSGIAVGQMPLFENNRIWPTGVPYIYGEPCNLLSGYPNPAWVPHEWRAEYFRKGLHRLINRTVLAELYPDPYKEAKYWLPQGPANLWIKPNLKLPICFRGYYDDAPGMATASSILNEAGFTPGTKPNPYYNSTLPWSSPTIRIDPISGLPLDEMTYTYYPACSDPLTVTGIGYYTIGPRESLVAFEMALTIVNWWRTAGIPIELVTITYTAMSMRVTNRILEDYQIMTGLGFYWDPKEPYILYRFTHSQNLPLWNFVHMNYSEPYDGVSCTPPPVNPYEYSTNRDADYWGEQLLIATTVPEKREAAHEIQEVLGTHEPYLPLIEWKQP